MVEKANLLRSGIPTAFAQGVSMSQTDHDNAEWVRRLQAGDLDAWNELFDRFGERLWRVICRTGGFPQGAEDQVEDIRQETLLAAARSIQEYRGSASVGTWLHRLAVNKTIDHLRKRMRRPDSEPIGVNGGMGEPIIDLVDTAPTPSEQVMQKERFAGLQQCLEALQARQERWWTMVMLRYFGDLQYSEVAEELAVPIGTVQAAVHRALHLLFDCLGGNKTAASGD